MHNSIRLGRSVFPIEILLLTIAGVAVFFAAAFGLIIGIRVGPAWAMLNPTIVGESTSAPEVVVAAPTKFAYSTGITNTVEGPPNQTTPTANSLANGQIPNVTPTATSTATSTRAATATKTPLPKPTATVKFADPVYKAGEVVRGPGGCDQYVVISGTTKDKSGSPIANASIRVTWKDNGQPRAGLFEDGGNATKSDAAGNWKVETPVKNASFRRIDFTAVVISEDGVKTFSPVVEIVLPACQMSASAQVNFEKQ